MSFSLLPTLVDKMTLEICKTFDKRSVRCSTEQHPYRLREERKKKNNVIKLKGNINTVER